MAHPLNHGQKGHSNEHLLCNCTHTHTHIYYVAAASSFLSCQTLKKRWGEREAHLNVSTEAKGECAQMHDVSRIDHGSRSHE
jgi:hypothetical protein